MRRLTRIFPVFLVSLLSSFASTGALAQINGASRASSETAVVLQAAIRAGRLDELRWPVFPDVKNDVDSFYRGSGYGLAWVQHGRPTSRAREMIESFRLADSEGLNPEDYDGALWAARVAGLQGAASPQDESRLDLSLTVGALRYVSALRMGRIDPLHFKFAFDVRHKKLDLPSFLRPLLTQRDDLKSELARI